MCSCDLAEAVNLAESTVSHHLAQLRRAGLASIFRCDWNGLALMAGCAAG
jgi:DNA-binding transcriptional ArsR family regulator